MDIPSKGTGAAVDLDSVIATAELSRRPFRPPDHEAENRALVALAQEMAISPGGLLQKLVETALELCNAHSAGISLLEEEDGKKIFRWHAITGLYAAYCFGTTPREFSPCGTVLDRNATQLFSYPDRYFVYFAEAEPRIVEGLLIPFAVGGTLAGTIWVLSHDESRKFDAEDARVLGNLAKFTAAAYQVLDSLAEHKRSRKALEEADRSKDEFLAVLAHELRNPLAPIRSAVQILNREEACEVDRSRARDVIDRQVQQMARLIDDLLDVSRITRGKIELRQERVELSAIVRTALETSRPLIESRGHELAVTLPPGPVFLNADPTRLAQVISNILNNAAKYTQKGGRIRLSAETAGGEAVVRVEDSGIGIAPSLLPHVFEMFTQADRSLERSQGGLGIGLALARRLIEMHGGTIEAHSTGPGQGSQLVVRCPVTEPPPPGTPAFPVNGDGAAAAGPGSRRVLVVDDNQDSTDSLSVLLRMLGYEVSTAYDGLEAVKAASTFSPDVVLLDIGLPVMNGYEAARRIRELPEGREILLIAVTGWGQEEDKRLSKEAGFDLHITKPLDPGALKELLAGTAVMAG